MTSPGVPRRAPHLLVQIPTPGDHYSPATGSAPITVIYELARVHAERGGATRIVVGRGTRHDYTVGECVEVPFGPSPSQRGKVVDAARGRLGLGRRSPAALYEPALSALAGADPRDAAVIVHNSVGGAAFVKSRRPDLPVVLYAHNELLGAFGRREARRALESLDGVVCDSGFLADRMRVAAPHATIAVVLNGVDPDRFCPSDGDRTEAEPTILFVGRVVEYKGPHLLLAAALRLQAAGAAFKVRIVGSYGFDAGAPLSEYELRLRELARPLGSRASFQPFVDRLAIVDEYRSASIFCAPSIWDEPCSLTVPEALASGLPTVATRRGGLPEVGGDAVLWFDPDDEASLADRLGRLVADPAERAAWGRRAREQGCSLAWSSQYAELEAALATMRR